LLDGGGELTGVRVTPRLGAEPEGFRFEGGLDLRLLDRPFADALRMTLKS